DEEMARQLAPPLARDSVETVEFTIVGRITQPTFEITSNYGALTVKLGDIRRVQRFVAEEAPQDTAKTVQVDGNNIANRNWKATTIKLDKGDQVTITADGTVTLTPWGSNALVTPEGAANYGWFIANQVPHGALVGRIGTA